MAATKLSQYQAALRHLGEPRLATITDDVEARYALDEAWDTATAFVLRTAPWRFALKQTVPVVGGTVVPNFSASHAYPADWLRTHAIFQYSISGIRECPIDFRERGSASFSVSVTSGQVFIRYVSNEFLLPAPIVTVGDLHSNTTIDGIPSTLGMLPGHGVSGIGIPTGSIIVSVNSGTSITVSMVTTAGTGIAIAVSASSAWPEHFAQLQAAYLAFSVAERVTGSSSTAQQMSQLFGSLLPEAVSIDAVEEDIWLPHQRSGAFLRAARAMIGEGLWQFALTAALVNSGSTAGDGGLARRFPVPLDWARTKSLYQLTTPGTNVIAQRRPFDVRERGGGWHTDATSFYAEYLSQTTILDSRLWPDLYMQAVLRRLEFGAAGGTSADGQQAAGATWKDALQAALAADAEPPDPWLAYQLSGAFARCVPAVISKGYWRQFLKSLQYNAEIDQDTFVAIGDYPYRFTLPLDLFKTHAVFVPWDGAEVPIDIREHEGHWSTATAVFMARYVSTAALDPAQWPDSLAKAVHAYLEFEAAPEDAKKNAAAVWTESLAAALREWSVPESPWLRFQFDGRYWEAVKFVLAAARWRGAIKTVTLTANATMGADGTISGTPAPTGIGDGSISPSYSAVFNKPGDWYRTIWIYRVNAPSGQGNGGGIERQDIDYRDEGGAWHANWDTIQVRYLSRDGLAGVRAPPSFRNAVMAWLQYEESGHDQKRLPAYQDLIQRAEEEDDTRERPLVNSVGRFVRARQGRGWGGSSGAGSIGGISSSGGVLTDDSSGETILTDDSGTVILTP